jgi:hypothetical protein
VSVASAIVEFLVANGRCYRFNAMMLAFLKRLFQMSEKPFEVVDLRTGKTLGFVFAFSPEEAAALARLKFPDVPDGRLRVEFDWLSVF